MSIEFLDCLNLNKLYLLNPCLAVEKQPSGVPLPKRHDIQKFCWSWNYSRLSSPGSNLDYGALCYVLGQDTLLLQCLSSARCINVYYQIYCWGGDGGRGGGVVTLWWTRSHPEEVETPLATSNFLLPDYAQWLLYILCWNFKQKNVTKANSKN